MTRYKCAVGRCSEFARPGRLTCAQHAAGRDSGSPWASPEVRLLSAFVDAWDAKGAFKQADFETAIRREEQRAEGKLSPAVRLVNAGPKVLRLFALPEGEGVRQLVGYVDHTGEWHEGEAKLTEREAQVMTLLLDGYGEADIRDALDRRRNRRGVPVLEIATVERAVRSGKAKLRELLTA